ncbi:MAG TPA: LysM peptidoglycan-binding domain-containing protein [Tepidisphaeraceae bacterium]|jgi:nucleoid-associated protein YgaU
MIRKEVKLGFAIGGVVLAVVVVWVLSVGGSSNKKTADAGAKAADTSAAKAITPSSDSLNTDKPAVVDASKPAPAPEPVAKDEPKKEESAAAPVEGTQTQTASADAHKSDLDWGKLLNGDQQLPLSASGTAQASDGAATPAPAPVAATPAPAPVLEPGAPAPVVENKTTEPTGSAPAPVAEANPAQPENQNLQIASLNTPSTPQGIATPAPAPVGQPTAAPETPAPAPVTQQPLPAPTVAVPQPASETQPAGKSGRSHVVQRGETLSSIASAAYGNSNYYPHILRANPNLNPNKMKPGMTIVLPDVADVKPHDVPGGSESSHQNAALNHAAQPAAATIDGKSQYKVQPNDSLNKISIKLYGNSSMVEKLYELNKEQIGADKARVKQGMVLKLPAAPTVTTSAH